MEVKTKKAINSFLDDNQDSENIGLKKIIKSDKSIVERLDKTIIVENNKMLLND